jgi:hypothetical protein
MQENHWQAHRGETIQHGQLQPILEFASTQCQNSPFGGTLGPMLNFTL